MEATSAAAAAAATPWPSWAPAAALAGLLAMGILAFALSWRRLSR